MTANNEKTDAAIIVRDLHRRFGQHEVLRGVNLDCPSGEITTIVGPSGCGKTVLLDKVPRPARALPVLGSYRVKLAWLSCDTDKVAIWRPPVL